MSVLSRPRSLSRPRNLSRTPAVPAPRPAGHDGGLTATAPQAASGPVDRTSRRRRAALVLAALVAAVAAGVATAVVQLTGDEPSQLAPGIDRGVTELDTLRDEVLLRRQLSSDASRSSDAARDAARAGR